MAPAQVSSGPLARCSGGPHMSARLTKVEVGREGCDRAPSPVYMYPFVRISSRVPTLLTEALAFLTDGSPPPRSFLRLSLTGPGDQRRSLPCCASCIICSSANCYIRFLIPRFPRFLSQKPPSLPTCPRSLRPCITVQRSLPSSALPAWRWQGTPLPTTT